MKFLKFREGWNKIQADAVCNEVKTPKTIKKLQVRKSEEFGKMMNEIRTLNQAKLLFRVEDYLSERSKIDSKDIDQLTYFGPFEKLCSQYLKCIPPDTSKAPLLGAWSGDEIVRLIQKAYDDKLYVFSKESYIFLNHDQSRESESLVRLFLGRASLKSSIDSSMSRSQSRRISVSTHKKSQCWGELEDEIKIMNTSRIKTDMIIANYINSINESELKENSYRNLMQQFLAQREEYEELEKQRDELRLISVESNIIDYNRDNKVKRVPHYWEEGISTHMSKEYINSYKKFGLCVDAYLGEILNQISFKMNKIRQCANVTYPKEIRLLIDAFNTQYEKTIADKIMIVNEMGRKLYVTSSPVFSKIDRIRPK